MCDPTTLMITTALAGGAQALGAYQQGQVSKQVAYNNARMAELAAADSLRRGEEETIRVRQRGDAIKSAQRSRMAAAGLDLGVGTAAELQDQTDFFSETDQSTTRFNAKRDAWSKTEEARGLRAQGRAAAQQGTLSAFATVLGTGASVASKWDAYLKPKGVGASPYGHGGWT